MIASTGQRRPRRRGQPLRSREGRTEQPPTRYALHTVDRAFAAGQGSGGLLGRASLFHAPGRPALWLGGSGAYLGLPVTHPCCRWWMGGSRRLRAAQPVVSGAQEAADGPFCGQRSSGGPGRRQKGSYAVVGPSGAPPAAPGRCAGLAGQPGSTRRRVVRQVLLLGENHEVPGPGTRVLWPDRAPLACAGHRVWPGDVCRCGLACDVCAFLRVARAPTTADFPALVLYLFCTACCPGNAGVLPVIGLPRRCVCGYCVG